MVGEARVGDLLGNYQLRALLGRGGMGDVFEAFDTVKQRTVALKILPAGLARDPEFVNRFRREAQSAAVLTEPHVIPIHDWGVVNGLLYIDMRLVRGASLQALIGETGPLPAARAVLIVSQIAAALDAAHATGLVHRDVKPENILISSDGTDFAYLVDFGIAADARESGMTVPGTTVGTYSYMAPERFGEGPVTGLADTYSLACVLHETLTGAPAFAATSPSAAIRAHLDAPPPRPSTQVAGIPVALDGVIARAMAKNPADRYSTSGEFARAAREAVTGTDPDAAGALTRRLTETAVLPAGAPYVPTVVSAPSPYWAPPYAEPAPTRRSAAIPILLALLSVGILALGGVVVWLVISGRDSDGANSATVASQSSSRSVAPTTTTVRSTTATAPLPPLVGSVSGADGQGFITPPTARCNATDPAFAIGRTTKSLVVVCRRPDTGQYYYKGTRMSDGAAIQLENAVPIPSGFTVTNPTDGTQYRITPSALVIVGGAGQQSATEPMLEYAGR